MFGHPMLLKFINLIRACCIYNSCMLCIGADNGALSHSFVPRTRHLLSVTRTSSSPPSSSSGCSDDRHVAHVRLKCLWDDHTAISLLKVLQDCHNHARHSTGCRVQCVYKLSGHFLCFLLAAIGGRSVRCICGIRPALQPQVVTTPLNRCACRASISRVNDASCKKSMPELDGAAYTCKLPVYGEVSCTNMLTSSHKVN